MLPTEDHFISIYKTSPAAYHALIAAEDADGNLLPALQSIAPLAGKRILDLGSGTGRFPLLLRNLECSIIALDLHRAMLLEQAHSSSLRGVEAKPRRRSNPQATLIQADVRAVPVRSDSFDVTIAGWVVSHFTGWFDDWKAEAKRTLDEMKRATKTDGKLIILETMGSGVLEPGAPTAALAAYYDWLEADRGFRRQIISTDYQFVNARQAAELCGTFFGTKLAAKVRANNWSRVPEWTGIWQRMRD